MSKVRMPLAKRAFASLGAAAIGLMGVVGLAGTAVASPGPDQPDHPSKGSLTISKKIGAEGTAGDGNPMTDWGGRNPEGLNGVEFSIWQVGVWDASANTCRPLDLQKTADWDHVEKALDHQNVAPGTDSGNAQGLCRTAAAFKSGKTTGTDDNGKPLGELKFTNLPLALYYVEETDAPPEVARRSDPFYVTIPYPQDVTTGDVPASQA